MMRRTEFDILDAAVAPIWKESGWVDFELLRDTDDVVLAAGVTGDGCRHTVMQWDRATLKRRVRPGEPVSDTCPPHLYLNTPLLVETHAMALAWLAQSNVVALPVADTPAERRAA